MKPRAEENADMRADVRNNVRYAARQGVRDSVAESSTRSCRSPMPPTQPSCISTAPMRASRRSALLRAAGSETAVCAAGRRRATARAATMHAGAQAWTDECHGERWAVRRAVCGLRGATIHGHNRSSPELHTSGLKLPPPARPPTRRGFGRTGVRAHLARVSS